MKHIADAILLARDCQNWFSKRKMDMKLDFSPAKLVQNRLGWILKV